jgi:hypothetical protein
MPEFSEIENTLEGIRKNGIEKLRKSKNLNIDAKNFQNEYNRFTQRIKAMVTLFFNKSKFDGIIINNDRNILTTVVFKANQLKSANPIIRQNGKIIPLSKRFNPSSDSIISDGMNP